MSPLCESDCLGKTVLEQGAIGQSGKGIVERHVPDSQFGLLPMRNIVGDSHGANDLARRILKRDFRGECPGLAPIRPGLFFLFLNHRLTRAQHLLFVSERLIGMFCAEDVCVGPSNCSGRVLQAEVVCHGSADAKKPAVCVLEEDIVRNVFKKRIQEASIKLMAPVHGRSEVCQAQRNECRYADHRNNQGVN
jgi:hypothetical protein